MRRSLLVTAVLLAGCTRPNPAFDKFGESDGEGNDEVVDGSEQDGSESGGSESDERDLPDLPVCEFQPADGLDLKFGDADYFGGTCPLSVDVWVRVVESVGGMAVVETCDPTCQVCAGPQPLSIYPLIVTDYLPADPLTCSKLETSVSLGAAPDVCQWGALSLFDGVSLTPYVIAVAHASEPTPTGAVALAGLIPDPVKVGNCNCDDVGQSHDCCYQAETPPEFWAYPWGDLLLQPGDSAPITLANQAGIQHVFEVFQAQRLHDCENPERALSWAVFADPL